MKNKQGDDKNNKPQRCQVKYYLKFLPLFFTIITAAHTAAAQQKFTPLQDAVTVSSFKNPPVCARPKALWPWVNGNFSLSQITYEMEQAKQKGMGGFDIWDVGAIVDENKILPAGPAFLSEQSLRAIALAAAEAKRLNMELGLITSSSWNAGGPWIEPRHAAMGLFKKDTLITGPGIFNAAISFPEIPADTRDANYALVPRHIATGLPLYYKNIATLAYKLSDSSVIENITEVVMLNKYIDRDGKLNWPIPAGNWHLVRYVCFPTGQQLALPSPASKGFVLDHFSAAAQQANMDYILQKLKAVLGNLKTSGLKYLYEDSYEVNSGVWTPLLAEAFEQRYGYSVLPWLPVLNGVAVADKKMASRFQFDFTKLLSDLIISNHYAAGRRMCKKAGLDFYAEAGGPGQPIHNVPFEDLKALGSLTVPRGEFWNNHTSSMDLQIVKGIASAAHIYNQKFVEAEAFTSVWLWQEGPGELKPLADRAMCEGLNRFVYHTFAHTPPESGSPGWIYNFGTIINTTNGWWPKSQAFHEYLGRSSYLLQQGNFVGDVAFYYGNQAPNFVKAKHLPPSLGNGYDYDVVNTDIILEKMTVKNHRIYLPHGQFYEVLVLPHQITMEPAVLKKLMQLVFAGATIIGPKPAAAYTLKNAAANDNLVQQLANQLWGNCDSVHVKENNYGAGKVVWGKDISTVLKEKNIGKDVQVQLNNAGDTAIDFIHRHTAGKEIYFLRNTISSAINGNCSFRVKNKIPEYWNAATGEIFPINVYSTTPTGISIPLSLAAEGACFIVFKSADIKKEKPVLLSSLPPAKIVYTKKGIALPDSSFSFETPWEVRFQKRTGSPVADTFVQLQSWHLNTNDGIKYFSGMAAYYNHFELTEPQIKKGYALLLWLNKVKEIAEVWVNGKPVGLHWHASQQLDITDAVQPGKNYIVIEVVNSISNQLIGDARLPGTVQQMRSNITRLPNAWTTNFKDAPLIEAGLQGPVLLQWAKPLTHE